MSAKRIVVECRECKQEMIAQPCLKDHIVTCRNPRCPMHGYTLSLSEYASVNLGPYLATAAKAAHRV